MAEVYFISDLHLGHRKIVQFSPNRFEPDISIDTHDELIVDNWNQVVTKRDLVWVLGDVCFDSKKLHMLDRLQGTKRLVIGNHDQFDLEVYQKYFASIHGFVKYKEFWLSHAPIHPAELRGKINIHGHVHNASIRDHYHQLDKRYINVCVEAVRARPISLTKIREVYGTTSTISNITQP